MRDMRPTGGGIIVSRAMYQAWLTRHGLTEGISLVGEAKIFDRQEHIGTTFRWRADGGDDVHVCPLPLRLDAVTSALRSVR